MSQRFVPGELSFSRLPVLPFWTALLTSLLVLRLLIGWKTSLEWLSIKTPNSKAMKKALYTIIRIVIFISLSERGTVKQTSQENV